MITCTNRLFDQSEIFCAECGQEIHKHTKTIVGKFTKLDREEIRILAMTQIQERITDEDIIKTITESTSKESYGTFSIIGVRVTFTQLLYGLWAFLFIFSQYGKIVFMSIIADFYIPDDYLLADILFNYFWPLEWLFLLLTFYVFVYKPLKITK